MKLKKVVKSTNGTRHQIKIQKNILSKYNRLVKNLLLKKKVFSGRNNTGRITVRHKGAGCKRKKQFLEWSPNYFSLVVKSAYNPSSNSFINFNFDLVRKKFFKTISVNGLYSGVLIESNLILSDIRLGYRSFLENFPCGSIIHSIGPDNFKKTVYAKSAGSFCQIIEKKSTHIKVKLPSGKIIFVPSNYKGTLGCVDNFENKLTVIGKAGRNRLNGVRPSVRGIAMNPVDHPHGGKSNKGMPQVTPWGLPTKNKPTVKKS